MQLKKQQFTIDKLFPFLLLCIFCISSLLFVYYGANQYNAAASSMEGNYNLRACISYLQDKVRENDCQGRISVQNTDNISLLKFTGDPNESLSVSYLYAYEDKLYELVSPEDTPFSPEMGTPLFDLKSLAFSMKSNHLLKIRITGSGGLADTIYINLNSMKQVSSYE